MNKIIYLLLSISLLCCNGEGGGDCLQKSGNIIVREYNLPPFNQVRIEGEVSLIIKQDSVQFVEVESGENLFHDISVRVVDSILVIVDENYCNLVREYGITKAFIKVPNLTEIRNSSSYDVASDGVLEFPNLSLVSNTTGGIENVRKGGDFRLNVSCENFSVSANGQSIFYISGNSQTANLVFSDEQPRFEGANFLVSEITIFQRSANKMIVNPIDKIEGIIRGTGDVLSLNRPAIIEVEEFYTGRLLFQD